MAEVAASVKASPFRFNPAVYRPPGNAACSWKRPETSSYAPEPAHALFRQLVRVVTKRASAPATMTMNGPVALNLTQRDT